MHDTDNVHSDTPLDIDDTQATMSDGLALVILALQAEGSAAHHGGPGELLFFFFFLF